MEIKNVYVYGLDNAVRVSKFPMAVDDNKPTSEVTNTTRKLFSSTIASGHDNALKGIVVQFDMTFTNKMSVELERYHFIDFISSQSTMHRITKFDIEKQCISYTDRRIIKIVQELVDEYNKLSDTKKNTEHGKDLYLRILYSVPSGFQLTAGFTTNYQQLKTIVKQRENHRLPEWREFCAWVHTLPKFDEFTGGKIEC